MSGKKNLFEGSSDEDDGDLDITINKDYAQRYEEWREAEVKRKLEDKYGDVDEPLSSSSSDDDEDPEELKQVLSKDFFEVIASLKTKNPKIYNPEVQFFKNEKQKGGFDPLERLEKKKEVKSKPIFLRDYERKLITERGGKLSDDDSNDEQEENPRAHSPTYVEEQRQLKESFKKALQDENSDEDDLLMKKEKTKEEKRKEEEDYIEWLKGERAALADKETEESLKPLQNLWSDPKLDDGEKFLRDYILNKRYLEKGDEPPDTGDVTDEDYQDEYMNEFERKYNFRFEEPDREFLKRYPRTMEQSLRKKDTRRKERREAIKQRKEEEKKRKREELKVLKALKRKEILKKIEKIKEITGNEELGLNPDELEEDFDPEAHDRKMKELFNEDYYGGADDAEDEDGLNLPPLEQELLDDDNVNWDEWDGTDKNAEQEQADIDGGADDEGPYCEDPDFNMDCDYDPAMKSLPKEEKTTGRQSAREKRKLKRQSRFGRLVRKEKPVFDPKDKTFDQYVDEYYGMDYEDLIGDIPCRFKYKSVAPNSFGLTVEEILAADDKELNQWASIKKTYTIRPDNVEKYEAKVYAQKAQNEELKRKILPSLYRHENEPTNQGDGDKKKKRKKNKSHDQIILEEEPSNNTAESVEPVYDDKEEAIPSEKKKKKKKKQTTQAEPGSDHAVPFENGENQGSQEIKKKKRKNMVGAIAEDQTFADRTLDSLNSSQSTSEGRKKKKKKQKMKNGIDHESSGNQKDGNPSEIQDPRPGTSVINEMKSKKRKHQDIEGVQSHKMKGDFNQSGGPKKKFKRGSRNNVDDKRNQPHAEVSDSRLKAYGLNPKRFRNKLKYGPQK